jgi:hypothetical protein
VVISGMTPGGYNGTYTIASATGTGFTYALNTNPGGPATAFGTATPAAAVTAATWAANVATVTAANSFAAGQTVVISGMTPGGYNGTYVIASATGTGFTYALNTNPGGPATAFGTAAPAAAVTAATWAANTVTVTAANSFVTGQTVVISGMTPAGYNGTYTIANATSTGFTYSLSTNPGGPATFVGTTTAGAIDALGFSGGAANSDGGLPSGTKLVAVSATAGLAAGSAVHLESHGVVIGKKPVGATVADGHAINVTADGAASPVVVTFHNSDFKNPAAITPGEVAAAINRQAQGFTAALTHDNHLVLFSNSTGAASTLTVAAPASGDASAEVGLDSVTTQAGTRLYLALDRVDEKGRYVTWKDGATTAAILPPFPKLESVEFDFVVYRDGTEVERFDSLSMQSQLDWYVASTVNNPGSGSHYVAVSDKQSASGVGLNAPLVGTYPLSSVSAGADDDPPADLDFIGDPAQRTGLYAFDKVAIQLLACPETTSKAVVSACLTYCENRGDVMFVGTAGPPGTDKDAAKTYAATLRARKVYGALYSPRINVVNPLDLTGNTPLILIPADGHVLGAYARIADARGVWKAPAGDEAVLNNALGVEFDMTDVDHTDLVKAGGVNSIRAIPGSGIVIDASRTLSTDTRWLYVGTRRLFNYVKASLRDGLRWVAQEPHTEELRRKVRFNVVRAFLLGLWRRGAFGSSPPDKVFTVKCDAENNSPTDVSQGLFNVEVYFYPVKPAETIIIQVGQQDSGATTAERGA